MKRRRPLKPTRDAIWDPEAERWTRNPKRIWAPAVRAKMPKIRLEPKVKNLSARQKREKVYVALKKEWRKNPKNHFCQAICKEIGMTTPAEKYPHHKKGRAGILLNDIAFFMPVCHNCHRWIHENPKKSYQKGWLIKHG